MTTKRTLGLLARTYKDAWEVETDPGKKRESLTAAQQLYLQGYQHAIDKQSRDGALYAGINAATMSHLLAESDEATKLANSSGSDFPRKA